MEMLAKLRDTEQDSHELLKKDLARSSKEYDMHTFRGRRLMVESEKIEKSGGCHSYGTTSMKKKIRKIVQQVSKIEEY